MLIASNASRDTRNRCHPATDAGEKTNINAEPECGHRHHRQERRDPGDRRHDTVGHELQGTKRGKDEKADDEPRHQRTRTHGVHLRRVRPVRGVREQGTRPAQHQDADQFHQRPDTGADQAGRNGGREHLRYRIDRESGEDAVLRRGQRNSGISNGSPRRSARRDGGEGDRGRDVVAVGADHRRDGRDRGIAADRVAAGNQDATSRVAQPTAGRGEARASVTATVATSRHQQAAGGGDGSSDRRAEQHHGRFEQLLGAEGDTGLPARSGFQTVRNVSRSGSP